MDEKKIVGVRELKQRAPAIVREIREAQATYDVTYRGRVVARIVPASEPEQEPFDLDKWEAELDELAERIGKHWPKGLSAEEAIRDDRSAVDHVLGWETPWHKRAPGRPKPY